MLVSFAWCFGRPGSRWGEHRPAEFREAGDRLLAARPRGHREWHKRRRSLIRGGRVGTAFAPAAGKRTCTVRRENAEPCNRRRHGSRAIRRRATVRDRGDGTACGRYARPVARRSAVRHRTAAQHTSLFAPATAACPQVLDTAGRIARKCTGHRWWIAGLASATAENRFEIGASRPLANEPIKIPRRAGAGRRQARGNNHDGTWLGFPRVAANLASFVLSNPPQTGGAWPALVVNGKSFSLKPGESRKWRPRGPGSSSSTAGILATPSTSLPGAMTHSG